MLEIDSGGQWDWVQSCDRCQGLITRKRIEEQNAEQSIKLPDCGRQEQKIAIAEEKAE